MSFAFYEAKVALAAATVKSTIHYKVVAMSHTATKCLHFNTKPLL